MTASAIAPKSQQRRPGRLLFRYHTVVRCTVSIAYVA
jgi:hypothetical protein